MEVAELSEAEAKRLRKVADRRPMVAILLGIFLPPIAYVYIGRYRYAILNLITLNYLLLGIVIVPLQARSAIKNARRELTAAGIPRP